jgi:plastocyanin
MNKKTLTITIVAVVVLVAAIVLLTGTKGPGTERSIGDLEKLDLPRVGEEAPEVGVGVPGEIAEGETGNVGQEYWIFETELKDGKLNPFEFRVPVGDIIGIAILNGESETHTVSIFGPGKFVPNEIERTIAPGDSATIRTQALEAGVYDVLCSTCKEQVIGNFIIVPKKAN